MVAIQDFTGFGFHQMKHFTTEHIRRMISILQVGARLQSFFLQSVFFFLSPTGPDVFLRQLLTAECLQWSLTVWSYILSETSQPMRHLPAALRAN